MSYYQNYEFLGVRRLCSSLFGNLQKLPKQQYGNLYRYESAYIHILTRSLVQNTYIYVQMPFTCDYCPTETISHLITDHHDRKIKIERMLRTLILNLFQKCVASRAERYQLMTARRPFMCQNLIKYQRIVPLKILIKTAGGASQHTKSWTH